MSRRSIAAVVEPKRIKLICDNINNFTSIGISLIEGYERLTGKKILSVEPRGGINNHYDFLIIHIDGTIARCEEKGTEKYNPRVEEMKKPWENSVQFYNGPAKYFSTSQKYLRLWYDMNVNNKTIQEKYNLPMLPSFDKWLDGGPHCMLNPKCEYSKVLKENYREVNCGGSMNGFGKTNQDEDYRKKVNDVFIQSFTEQDKGLLIKEVQKKYDQVMNEKDIWLQTTGSPESNFSFKWYEKIDPLKIIKVDPINKKDIEFKFTLENGNYITGIMRWGKGCGFSCFRMDLK